MSNAPIKVLIIDDCAEDREFIRVLLNDVAAQSDTICEAVNASEGARAMSECKPDCVLLDNRLPDVEGLTFLKKLVAGQRSFLCPIVMITGSPYKEVSDLALSYGAHEFILKREATSELLARTINHAIIRCRLLREREKTVKALAESEERFRLAEESGAMGSFDWNLATGETCFGGAYFQIYGLPRNSPPITFEQWLALVHPEDRASVRAETARALAEVRPFSYEYRVTWPDESRHWILGRGSVIPNDRGEPARLIGINVDITAGKSAEQALLAINEELQQFAYTAGHDLQAPLRTVGLFAELLEREFGPGANMPARRALDQVRAGAVSMHALVDDLLVYASAGGASPPRTRLRLNPLLERAVANLAFDIQAAGATVTWDDLPEVEMHGDELLHVFQNLVGNAITYRRQEAPPLIHVSVIRRSNDYVLAVKDNGRGFSMSSSALIFEPFQRLDVSSRTGTGLGLAICRRIVERHGGKIWAESEPGNGATFLFTLPCTQADYFDGPRAKGGGQSLVKERQCIR